MKLVFLRTIQRKLWWYPLIQSLLNNIQPCILFGVEAMKFIFNIDLIILNVSHLQNPSCIESIKTICNLFNTPIQRMDGFYRGNMLFLEQCPSFEAMVIKLLQWSTTKTGPSKKIWMPCIGASNLSLLMKISMHGFPNSLTLLEWNMHVVL